MLVHRDARRRGVGALLLQRLEAEARALGRTLLVLDTETGSDAEHLYSHMGWIRAPGVPRLRDAPRRVRAAADVTLVPATGLMRPPCHGEARRGAAVSGER